MKKKVAVIGGGPAGLECAEYLVKEGFDVTIYEKHNYLGGLLMHGIPEFRLPKSVVRQKINKTLEHGIKVEYNQELGVNLFLEELKIEYDVIFLSVGANKPSKMNVEGEDLEGVFGGNELLEYNLHPDYTDKIVSVIGGGNVAMDCARTIKRLNAKMVNVIYRRAEEQMPADEKEIRAAKEEGINFLFQNNIVKIIGESRVKGLELVKTEMKQSENDSRPVPVNIENSNYEIETDYVVMAIGSMIQEQIMHLGLDMNKWGNVVVNENYQTSDPQIYAGGDLLGVKNSIAWAVKSGREAAKEIVKNLS